jgi:hypothetical protein
MGGLDRGRTREGKMKSGEENEERSEREKRGEETRK